MRKSFRLATFLVAVLCFFSMTACQSGGDQTASDISAVSGETTATGTSSENTRSNNTRPNNTRPNNTRPNNTTSTTTNQNNGGQTTASQNVGYQPLNSKSIASAVTNPVSAVTSSKKQYSNFVKPLNNTGIPSAAAIKKLEDLFNGKAKEERSYSLAPNVGGMHFTDSVWVKNICYTYYISGGADGSGISRAESVDGISFYAEKKVLSPVESYEKNYATFPGVWYENGTYYLVYECAYPGGADIALATSTDGINFTKHGIILRTNKSLGWQNINIGTPDLYKANGIWYLTFHGFGSTTRDCQIGIAYGSDIRNLTMVNHPIVPTSTNPSDPDSGTTGRRDIIKAGDWYYMVYEISSDMVGGNYESSNWGHSFARSRDMLNWEVIKNYNRVTTGGGMGYDGPSWMVAGGDIWVHCRYDNNTVAYKFVSKD